jgi:prepilin-type N-terminal cleavage/methylation domain-containing protein
MVFRTTFSKSRRLHRQRGLTLFELLIALGIAALLLIQVCCLWFYSTRSFASQMAYVELDQKSQRALDTLSRDIRQVKALTFFATNRLVFTAVDDLPLEFRYTPEKKLLRIKNNNLANATELLKECQGLNFSMFQRTPMAGQFQYYPTDDVNLCKLIEVRWICSRKLFPTAPSTTESVQAAKIVLRSHKNL